MVAAVRLTVPILGQVDANGTVAGRWPRLGVDAVATLHDGSVYGYAVRQGTLHARSDGTRLALTEGVLDLGFARFDASGSFGFDAHAPLALAVHGQTPDLAKALTAAYPKGPHYDVAGAVQADARIGGSFAKPNVTAGFDVTNARYASLAIARILGSATYDGTTLTVNDAEATFAKGNLLVAGSLPLRLQPFGVRPDAPVSFTLGLSKLDLAPFAPFVPGHNTKLGGTLDGRVAIEGTARAPQVIGNIALADGSYLSDFDRAGVDEGERAARLPGDERGARSAACEPRRRYARRRRQPRSPVRRDPPQRLCRRAQSARRAGRLTAVRARDARRCDATAQRDAVARSHRRRDAVERVDPVRGARARRDRR